MTFLPSFKFGVHTAMLLWPACLALTGCGAKDEPKYPDANSFCGARAKAECNDEVVKACAVADATHCISKRQAACVGVIPPNTVYNPGGAEGCISAVTSAYADAKLTAEENRSAATVCALVFDGPGAANATCEKDVDCKVSTGLRCVLGGGAAGGSCQIPQRVQGGGSCASPSQMCVEGYHCGASQHCDVDSQVGETCSALLPCAPTAQCGTTGVCVSKLSDGAACAGDDECLHDLCARGTGTAQGLCVAQMTLAPNEPFCIDAR